MLRLLSLLLDFSGAKRINLTGRRDAGRLMNSVHMNVVLKTKRNISRHALGMFFFYKFICFCACVYGVCGVHVWKPEDSLECWSLPLTCLRQGILLTAELCTPGLLVGELLEGQLSTPHFTEGGLGPHTLLRVSADPSSGCRAYRASAFTQGAASQLWFVLFKMWVY